MINELFSLKNKVIIITGAGGLLGRKHAEIVAAAGGIPILLDITHKTIDQLAIELNNKFQVRAKAFVVDITNEALIKENCKTIIDEFGSIDGLVNNAANNPKVEGDGNRNFSRLEFFEMNTWNDDIAVGLTGAFLCIKHYGLAISKQGGSIVNISSDLGIIAPDQRLYMKANLDEASQPVKPITYSVIKTALIGMTRYVSTYWATKGVRCNVLCPGGVENNQDMAFITEVCKRIPMNRMANVGEYQGALLFLLSNASSYMNGAILSVDGGRTAW